MGAPALSSTEEDSSLTPAKAEEWPAFTVVQGLVGILIRPRATFEAMRHARRTHWWLVLVLMAAATALLIYATAQARANLFTGVVPLEGLEPPAGIEAPQGVGPSSSTSILATILPAIMGIAGVVIGYIVCVVVIFGMGLAMGGKATFKQLLPVAVWSTLPLVVRKVIQAAASLVTGRMAVAGFSGLFTMAERVSMPLLYTLLEQLDVYLVWNLVLLGIGVATTSRLKASKAVVIVLTYLAVAAGLLLASNAAYSVLSELLGANLRMPGLMGPPGRRG